MSSGKDAAFASMATPVPYAAMSSPATPGPIIRPAWNDALLRATALARCPGPTISTTNARRVGLSNAVVMPPTKATAYSDQTGGLHAGIRHQTAGQIRDAIAATGAASVKDMGKVMAIVKAKAAGRTDMGAASARIKAALSA